VVFFRYFFIALLLTPALVLGDASQVSLEGAWVRALPPTQPNTAAYLTIRNTGDSPISILDASTEMAQRVEFHTTREVDGYVRMEQLSTLDVAADKSLSLAPGGVHLMLLGLAAMPVAGSSVRLCLTLEGGEEVCTDAPVRKDAGESDHQHHHH
jgi:copper(I)-binding protein